MPKAVLSLAILLFSVGTALAGSPYEGVWSSSKETCRQDEDGVERLTIKGKSFGWYESYCEAGKVSRAGNTWTLRLSCQGEGETWRSTTRLSLRDRNTLVLDDAPVGPTKHHVYVRCAAQ